LQSSHNGAHCHVQNGLYAGRRIPPARELREDGGDPAGPGFGTSRALESPRQHTEA